VRAPFEKEVGRVLGKTESLLYRRGNFNGTFDDLICDAIIEERDAQIALSPGFRWGATLLPGQDIRVEEVYSQTAITYPNGKVVPIDYNDQGLVESITGYLLNADYTSVGQINRLAHANGVTSDYAYDPQNQRLSRISAASVMDLNYQYDSVGNIMQVREDARGWTKNYTYDDLNRLLSGDGRNKTPLVHYRDRRAEPHRAAPATAGAFSCHSSSSRPASSTMYE